MEYKITKIKTKDGQMGMPINVKLDGIVSRMMSNSMIKQVENVASNITWALLEQQKLGNERVSINGIDDLPFLIFSATFGRHHHRYLYRHCRQGHEVRRRDDHLGRHHHRSDQWRTLLQ